VGNTKVEQRIYPWEYTTKECGTFYIWRYGSVTRQLLVAARKKAGGGKLANINGVQIHALIFESASAGICGDVIGRWDVVNGWTTTLGQAKKRFPNGLHGKPNKYNKG
jgi:hypothetical protein